MYKRTTFACMTGIFMQALIGNLTAILFVPLRELYGLGLVDLGILVAVNFCAQIVADIILSRIIDKVNFRPLIYIACALVVIGLALFACTPWIFKNAIFAGFIVATVVFSFAAGMCEVMLSPIVNNIPRPADGKGAAMSLMHGFYAWGQVLTIVLTTVAVAVFSSANWQYIVFAWLIVPVLCFVMFARAPIYQGVSEEKREKTKKILFHPYYIVALLAILFGAATEITMNQWISTFAEIGLQFPKVVGDLLGMCMFALTMGIGRTLYGIFGKKINIRNVTLVGSICCAGCYVAAALIPVAWVSLLFAALCGFFSSLLWPGTLTIATDKFPMAGAWLFAVLALSGDVGAAVAPYLTGLVTDLTAATGIGMSLRWGLLAGAVFPVLAFLCHAYLRKNQPKKQDPPPEQAETDKNLSNPEKE